MSEPLVSVIVCTNRGGPYLAEALESVRAQTYPRVECLVVDDGSPDVAALHAILAGFPEIRVVRTEPTGISAARNRGIAETSGEFIAFLDDDDRWAPERLELQVAGLVQRPDTVAGYCGMRTVDAAGEVLVAADQFAVRDRLDVARGRGGILLPNLVLRRASVEQVGGFSPRFRQAEDLDLVLRLADVGSFDFVAPALVDYRHHDGNTTAGYRTLAESIREVVREHAWAARRSADQGLVTALRERDAANDRFAAWSAARAARAAFGRGEVRRALGDLAWAAHSAPGAPASWLRQRMRLKPSTG